MKDREELELILKLIRKYNLPLSPILEYAINEKMEMFLTEEQSVVIDNNKKAEENTVAHRKIVNNDMSVDSLSDELRIVDYGERTIAVVGDTKPHKDALKSIGGFFVFRTQWGPAWVFRDKKRDIVQAYIDGETSVITRVEKDAEDEKKKKASRYIIRVEYPDGKVFESNLVWETLVDVVKYAGPENVARLNILCMGDNLISSRLNENPLYRSAQKEIGKGLYVCTYSSTDIKFKQIVRINQNCHLGLKVEKVYIDENGEVHADRKSEAFTMDDHKTGSRDRTKYSFEGGEFLSKRRFVFEVVKYYVRCHPQISYESLIRVFPATLHSNKSNGVIKRYNDVAKQIALNPDVRNRFFMKDDEVIALSNGMKIVVHNQWGDDFEKFLKVAKSLYMVKSSDESDVQSVSFASNRVNAKPMTNLIESKEDKRIGYTVRIFPSQFVGQIIRVRVNNKGIRKLIIRNTENVIVEVDDVPYLYEVLKRG